MFEAIAAWRSRLESWSCDAAHPRRIPALIFTLLLLTGFIGAAQTGLFDRDEPRYAQAAREMLASGDWVVPSFNGEPRLHKPVLIYWLMSASLMVLGDSPLAARFPAIVAGAMAGVLLYEMARGWWGRRVALWAMFVWATMPLTLVESRMATTDAVLNLFTLGMMACVARLYQGPDTRVARLFWALLGLSILTKGPVGLLVVIFAVLATRYFAGVKLPMEWLRPRSGFAICLAIVMPWLILATVRTHGDFLRFAVGQELLGRTVAPAQGHWGVPGYYIGMAFPLMFPWSCFLPMAMRRAWGERKTDPRLAFLIGWAVGPLLVLELLATKLVHYHYASYAALAILIGRQICLLEPVTLRPGFLAGGRFLRGALISGVGIAAMLFFGLAWASVWSVAIPSLVVAGVLAYLLWKIIPALNQGQWASAFQLTATGWVVASLLILGWWLPGGDRHRLALQVSGTLGKHARQLQVPVALGEFREPSVIYDLRFRGPVAISRSVTNTRQIVKEKGAVLMALGEPEIRLVEGMSDVVIQRLDGVQALDWDRGRRDSLVVCLLTRRPEERLAELPGRSNLVPKRQTPDPIRRY